MSKAKAKAEKKAVGRYEELGMKESLHKMYQYPIACKELSFILRLAYNQLPKVLQSLVFQDTLTAFRLLPHPAAPAPTFFKNCRVLHPHPCFIGEDRMQTCTAASAAHLLYQSAEAALPKQKRNLAITEFKHAMVAHKRRQKACQEERGSAQLPLDVLVHIFSFLDVQSVVSVGLVCWSWNIAASDNHLWQLQYASVFGSSENCLNIKKHQSGRPVEDEEYRHLQEAMTTRTSIDWRGAFIRAYIGNASKNLTSSRGYCVYCGTIVWLNNMKCSDGHQQITPYSPHQVAKYILNDSSNFRCSSDSDSDSDSDEGSGFILWAYPRDMF
ncbi:F-box protein At5g52880 isoform X1 [Castanea sativa]|uniref:F-box protein At5g52880 isoform X1 n=1 Tax=Castanea sativa TaxID=21020 RepID=UPI003F64BF19